MVQSFETWLGVAIASLLFAAVLTGAAPEPGAPVTLTAAQRARILTEIRKDRAETRQWLKSDISSYLATVDRRDFDLRHTLTVGRAPDNDVSIDDAAFSAHHLRVSVEGDQFRVEAVDPSATFTADKKSTRSALVKPTALGVGRFQLRLSHQRYPAIIVFDPKSPHFASFKGLTYFPPDLSLRYELPLTPNPKPETVVIMSTRGNQRQAARVGWFEFRVDGVPVRLEAVRLLEPGADESWSL